MLNGEVRALAEVIWDYHRLNMPLTRADVMLVLGGHDLRVPTYAAELFTKGFAPLVMISGGIAHSNDLLKTGWDVTEAEKFAEVVQQAGVPRDKLLLEKKAENTGENFSLSEKLLNEHGIAFSLLLVVTKPYMERRAYATGKKRLPHVHLVVTSPPCTFDTYLVDDDANEDVLNIMMGDLQRIDLYGRNGFQIPQQIPDEVWRAFEALKNLGYTKHLIHV